MERYLRVNLLGPGPLLMEKEFTGPRSHKFEKHWSIAQMTLACGWRVIFLEDKRRYLCTATSQYRRSDFNGANSYLVILKS